MLRQTALERRNSRSGEARVALTPREREVARLVAVGASNKEIARQLSITERTVKAHLTNVFEKLGCSSRLKLALYTLSRELAGSDFGPMDGRAELLLQEGSQPDPVKQIATERQGRKALVIPTAPTPMTGAADSCIIIVSPSRPDVFRTLQENFQERVIWDRRVGDRRQGQRRTGRLAPTTAGRRQGERRGAPRPTWEAYGFVLAPSTEGR